MLAAGMRKGSQLGRRWLCCVCWCVSMLALDGDKRVGDGRPGSTLAALSPAPTASADYTVIIYEHDFSRFGMRYGVAAQIREPFVSGREAYGRRTGHRALIENCDRNLVAETDKIGYVNQRIDRRDGSLFGKTSQECFCRVAVLGGFDSKSRERGSPSRQTCDFSWWCVFEPSSNRELFCLKCFQQARWSRWVGETGRIDHASPNRREPVDDLRRISEVGHQKSLPGSHAHRRPKSRTRGTRKTVSTHRK